MTEEKARKIAATAAGIREDQVDVAVKAYREALCDLFNDEPEWYVALFFAGSATCVAEGTEIQMHFHPTAGKTPSQRLYVYRNKSYNEWGEARAEELLHQATFKIRTAT